MLNTLLHQSTAKLFCGSLCFSLAVLLSLSSISSQVYASNKGRFNAAVKKLRNEKIIMSREVGVTAVGPTKYYKLTLELLKHGTEQDFEELLKDEQPIVRATALICLAQIDFTKYSPTIERYRADLGAFVLMEGCIISNSTVSEVARSLLESPKFLGHK